MLLPAALHQNDSVEVVIDGLNDPHSPVQNSSPQKMLQQSVPQTLENGKIFFGKDGKGSCWEPYHTPCNASQQKNDMLAIWPAPLFFVLPGVGRQDSFLSLFLVYKTQKVMLACVLFLLLLVNLNAIDNSFHVKFRGECIMKLKA